MDEAIVKINRSDLIYLRRVLDSIHPLLEEIIEEGNEEPELLIELVSAIDTIDEYLR